MSYADQPKHGSVEPLNFQNPRIYINFPHIMHHDIHIYWICLRCVQFLFARIARLRVGFTTHGTGVLWAWNWLFSDYQSIHQIRDILALLELFLICKSKIPVSPAPNITSIRFILIPGHIQMWQMTHFCGVMVINSRDSETTQECQMWSQVSTCRWISQCRVKVFYLEISWSYHMIAESRKKKVPITHLKSNDSLHSISTIFLSGLYFKRLGSETAWLCENRNLRWWTRRVAL